MDKSAVVAHIQRIGNLYEMQGEGWKAKSFLNAARILGSAAIQPQDIKPKCLPGVGESVADTAQEFLATGTSQRLQELERALPPILGLLDVPGIGPKTALVLHMQHGVTSVDELETALRSGLIQNPKLLASVEFLKAKGYGRIPRSLVTPLVEALLTALRAIPGVQKAEAGGSYRRKLETVKDVDILVCAPGHTNKVAEVVAKFGSVESSGDRKLVIRAEKPVIQVDVLLVEPVCWGAALCYFTGSKEHNVALRAMAKSRGLTINEYGIWRGEERLGGAQEGDLYTILGIPFVQPEDRKS